MTNYFSILFLSLFLATNVSGQIILTKDGMPLGERSDFISVCTKQAKMEMMNISGMEVNTEQYCSCVCDNLMPTLTSLEITQALENGNLLDLFSSDKNMVTLMECINPNMVLGDDFKMNISEQTEAERKIIVKGCVFDILSDDTNEGIWNKESAEQYCNCAMNRLAENGYTYLDLQELSNEDSESFNEIILPCVSDALLGTQDSIFSNYYNVSDIGGNLLSSKVPLTDYMGKGFKLKISIGGVVKYYLLDTGASDLIINSDLERELLLDGQLKRENYLGTNTFTLANNETVEAEMVQMDTIKIGDYTLSNVVVAIIKEGSLLCGVGLLSKFSKWEIDEEKKLLILYR